MLKPLKVTITGDTSGLENALNRASKNIGGLVTAAGAAGVAVAGALTLMAANGLRLVDANTKLARSMDGTVNGLRAVQLAAGYAGVSTEEVNTSLQNMNRQLATAYEKGTPAAEALRKLGLNVRDLQDLDADERMAKIADRVHELGLNSSTTSDLLRDLGVESRSMSLLMGQGGDAIRAARDEVKSFGLELSVEQTNAIEAANDALSRLTLVFSGFQQQLAAELAPVLQSIADRFTALSKSQSVQSAIERLVEAFGNLATLLTSEDFIGAVVSSFEGLVNISASAAEGMVTLSENVEIVTLAFSGLAIAIAAAGGPLTIIAGALAVALGGIVVWRNKLDDTGKSAYYAKGGQEALNSAMAKFYETHAPSAAKAAIAAANANYEFEASAFAAAEAALAQSQAILDAEKARVAAENAKSGQGEYLTTGTIVGASADMLLAQQELEAAKKSLSDAMDMRDQVKREAEPYVDDGSGKSDDKDGNGGNGLPATLGSSTDLQDQLKQRLDMLQTGLMTEREYVETWYAEGLDVLNDAREAELLTEQEYMDAKEKLEQEHQERLMRIRDAGNSAAYSSIVSGGEKILGSIGKTNKRAASAAKALGAFEAMVNAYRAGAQVLADPSLPWFMKATAAASIIATGIGFATSIRSMSDSGSGGSSGTSTSSVAAAPATQNVLIDFRGDQSQVNSLKGLVDMINEAGRNGYILNIKTAG